MKHFFMAHGAATVIMDITLIAVTFFYGAMRWYGGTNNVKEGIEGGDTIRNYDDNKGNNRN